MTHSNLISKGHILIVDDNPFNSDVLSRMLQHRDYTVSVVSNGHHAVDMVRREEFVLVLLDIVMPGIDGIEVLFKIRETHSAIMLPVIMLSGVTNQEQIVAAFRAGADDFISRPFPLSVGLARIEAQIRLREQASARLGELRKIGGAPITRPATRRFFCPQCLSCHGSYGAVCPRCDYQRRAEVWPRIEDSAFSFLGQTIGGRYFVEQFIGKGAVGQVYRAQDIDLKRDFAIKFINFNQVPPDVRSELRRQTVLEAEALARLENPYVVKIYQVLHVSDGNYALVMDFVRGFTLEHVLDEYGALEPWLAIDIARQIALALYSAHEEGILHRDVKPGNIMLEPMPTGDYFVRLLDFGIVQQIGGPTIDDSICGTPAYISPEQITSEDALDHRADIYSLGAVFYHMLTGIAPFEDLIPEDEVEDTAGIMTHLQHQLFTQLPPLPETLQPNNIVGPLNELLLGMMAKERADRLPDMSNILERLVVLDDKLSP